MSMTLSQEPLPGSTSVPRRPHTASSLVFAEEENSHGGDSANPSSELRHRHPLPPPPPPPPLLISGGTSTPRLASPSARTSFTRVDVDTLGDQEVIHHILLPMSQDRQEDLRPAEEQSQAAPGAPPAPAPPAPPPAPPEQHDDTALTAVPGEVSEAKEPMSNPVEQQQQQQQEQVVPVTPQTFVTFLLPSGKRRTMSFEPDTTVGRVKELIWNAWPSEWHDERPPAPSYLRMFYLGKMLQDDDTLTKLKLPPSHPHAPIPTIVHLSIRPYNLPGDDNTTKKKRKGSDALNVPDDTTTSSSCCGCVIC